MANKVKEMPNEPIIVISVLPPERGPEEAKEMLKVVTDFKHKIGGHVYRILDFSVLSEGISFSNLILAMGVELKQEGGINDEDVSTIYVGSSQWVVFGAKAFQEQPQYGKTNVVLVCESVEEALAFAREDIKKRGA